jgi:outer membrane lipoprotein LolB
VPFRRFAIVATICMALTGCVSLSTPKLEHSWSGRFSLSAQSATQQEHQSGHFELTNATSQTVLDLKSALGNVIARIEETDSYASVEALGKDKVTATDLNTLMRQTLGFTVPVTGLPYWIEGEPAPGSAAQTQPTSPPFSQIVQDGWNIRYETRDSAGAPRRIRINREADETTPALSMTLLIQERHHAEH